MVLFKYSAQSPNMVACVSQNCGIEAYRLLKVESDPIIADTEFGLLERFLMGGKFVCNSSRCTPRG